MPCAVKARGVLPYLARPEKEGSQVLRENGYLYDASYLLRVAVQGGPLLFRNDAEWLQYMQLGGVKEDER